MKICPKCKIRKDFCQFAKHKNRKGGLQIHCRLCNSIYKKHHYSNNKQYYINKATNLKKELRKLMRMAKNKPCKDCGIKYPYYVMDFDHVNGKKKICVSRLVNYNSKIILLAEIAKCEVVCSNCHRIRTYKKRAPTRICTQTISDSRSD